MTHQAQTKYCSECGQPAGPEELARFGDRLVCPNCKDAYAQKLREGVAPAGLVQFGGFWLRVLAAFIDGIILVIPTWIVQAFLFASLGSSVAQWPTRPNPAPEEILTGLATAFGIIGVSWLVSTVFGCTYETFFIVRFAATPGKMAVGVKVVRPDGSKLGTGRAIGRYFAKALSGMILCIGYIMAGIDFQKRALHDMICDTRVIKTRG